MANLNISQFPAASSIDPVADLLLEWQGGTGTTKSINRNTLLNLTSQPVGLTDSQTLTNKGLTAPAISAPVLSGTVTGTYTLGGTPTFPASVVTLTGSQTLTNKILTSPTINSPTITNATISTDTVTGFSVSTNVTVGNVTLNNGAVGATTVTTSGLVTAGNGLTVSAGSVSLPNNAIQANALATSAITLGYAQITSSFTNTTVGAYTDVTSLTVTVTVPAGGRRIKISTGGYYFTSSAVAGTFIELAIIDVTGATQIGGIGQSLATSGYGLNPNHFVTHVPASGSRTYKIQFKQANAGTFTYAANSSIPAFILVEAI